MEEKVLIVGKKKKKSIISWMAPGLVLLLIGFALMELATLVFSRSKALQEAWELSSTLSVVFYIIGAVVTVIGIVYWFAWGKCQLTVTTKRVYGVAAFGRRVDLPIDSISAIGTSSFNGIAVTTASGAIKFVLMKNNDEIHRVVSKLLVDRQNKTVPAATIRQEVPQSKAHELKEYKELLDMGVISQEEFDAKKKQLLGL